MPDWSDQLATDRMMDMLEGRISQLEEIAAASWPRRVVLARGLRIRIRTSIRHMPGDTFADRRAEAIGTEWDATPGAPQSESRNR